jgi:hypothetical protein
VWVLVGLNSLGEYKTANDKLNDVIKALNTKIIEKSNIVDRYGGEPVCFILIPRKDMERLGDMEDVDDASFNVLSYWWRYSEGSTLGNGDYRFSINSHWMDGFKSETPCLTKYDDIFQYMCNELGLSVERNITAVLMDLAYINGLTPAELLNKYAKLYVDKKSNDFINGEENEK